MTARAECGCLRSNLPAPARSFTDITQGLAGIAECLTLLAQRIQMMGVDTGEDEITRLASLAVIIEKAACELRIGRQGRRTGASIHLEQAHHGHHCAK